MSVSPASWHSPDPAPSSTPTASSTGQAFAARATRLRAKPAAPHAAPTGADHSRRRWPAGWTRVPAPRVTAPITPSTASRFEPRSTSSGSDDTDMAGKAYTQNAVGATTSQKAGADPVGSRSWTSRPGRGSVTVSGTENTATRPVVTATMWARYGSVVGAGPHCASRPLVNGPSENPSVMANVARRAATCGREWSETSCSQALNTTNNPEATADRATNGRTTGRRPSRSEDEPARNSAGVSPAAYTAKIAVSVAVVSPSRSRYTSSSGTGMFVPKATVNRTSDSAGHPPCRLRVTAGDDTADTATGPHYRRTPSAGWMPRADCTTRGRMPATGRPAGRWSWRQAARRVDRW